MKSAYYLVVALGAVPCLFAQKPAPSIDGIWQGALLFGQGKIRTVFYFSSSSSSREGAYKGAMVNLESGAGSNIDSITVANGKLGLELKSLGFKFEGTLAPPGDEIRGKFTQGDTTGDLTLTRSSQSHSDAAASYQKHEYMIPMRDGIHLHTMVFSPK